MYGPLLWTHVYCLGSFCPFFLLTLSYLLGLDPLVKILPPLVEARDHLGSSVTEVSIFAAFGHFSTSFPKQGSGIAPSSLLKMRDQCSHIWKNIFIPSLVYLLLAATILTVLDGVQSQGPATFLPLQIFRCFLTVLLPLSLLVGPLLWRPWLRPRDYTSKGDVVQSPLAYHPKNLLYDIAFFGSWESFCAACLSNQSHLYPNVPFKKFLPEFWWKEWDALLAWKADFDSQLTPQILETVSKLQEFYSNPHIYLPFRLPSLEEKAEDSELTTLIATTQQEANPPLLTLHNIIGNFFKPSAVLAALGGTNSIKNFVNGSATPHQWSPSPPIKWIKNFLTSESRSLRISLHNLRFIPT